MSWKEKNICYNPSGGYLTLLSVLIISAVSVSITVSLLLLGVNSSKGSVSIQDAYQAKALANACTEEALQEIRNDSNYTGTDNLTLTTGQCQYDVQDSGVDKTIASTGTSGSAVKKISLVANVADSLVTVISWQEVADF